MVHDGTSSPISSGSEVSSEEIQGEGSNLSENSEIVRFTSSSVTTRELRKQWPIVDPSYYSHNKAWEYFLNKKAGTADALDWLENREVSLVQFALVNIDSLMSMMEKDVEDTLALALLREVHAIVSVRYADYLQHLRYESQLAMLEQEKEIAQACAKLHRDGSTTSLSSGKEAPNAHQARVPIHMVRPSISSERERPQEKLETIKLENFVRLDSSQNDDDDEDLEVTVTRSHGHHKPHKSSQQKLKTSQAINEEDLPLPSLTTRLTTEGHHAKHSKPIWSGAQEQPSVPRPRKVVEEARILFDSNDAGVNHATRRSQAPKPRKSHFNPKYTSLVPQMGNAEDALEFLNRFEAAVFRYSEINEAWLDYLLAAVNDSHLESIFVLKDQLEVMSFKEAKVHLLQILAPHKSINAYRKQLNNLKPKFGESMFQYKKRFLNLAKICEVDGSLAASIFFKSLPKEIQEETKKTTAYRWDHGIFTGFDTVEEAYEASFRAVVHDPNVEAYTPVGKPVSNQVDSPGKKQLYCKRHKSLGDHKTEDCRLRYCEVHSWGSHSTAYCPARKRDDNPPRGGDAPGGNSNLQNPFVNDGSGYRGGNPSQPRGQQLTNTQSNQRGNPTPFSYKYPCKVCNKFDHRTDFCPLLPGLLKTKQDSKSGNQHTQTKSAKGKEVDGDSQRAKVESVTGHVIESIDDNLIEAVHEPQHVYVAYSDVVLARVGSDPINEESIVDSDSSDVIPPTPESNPLEIVDEEEDTSIFANPLPSPKLPITIGGVSFEGDMDSCAQYCLITTAALDKVPKAKFKKYKKKLILHGIIGESEECDIVVVEVLANKLRFNWKFGVYKSDKVLVTLSWDFINFSRIPISLITSDQVHQRFAKIEVKPIDDILLKERVRDQQQTIYHPDRDHYLKLIQDAVDRNTATSSFTCTLPEVVLRFKNPETRAIGVFRKQRPMSLKDHDLFKYTVLPQWLEADIAERFNRNNPSLVDPETGIVTGNFNLVIFPVFSGGKVRFVGDYKPLNGELVEGINDVPSVMDVLLFISGMKPDCISKIDCDKAFLQILLRECDRNCTAFTFDGASYRFKRAQLGIAQIPSDFEQRIRELFASAGLEMYVWVHIDDVFIGTVGGPQVHTEVLIKVLDALTSVKMTIGPAKCEFFCTQMVYLGHIVNINGVQPWVHKVSNMLDWVRPTNKSMLRRYLGICNFFRTFLPDAAHIFAPFYKIKTETFDWTPELEYVYKTVFKRLVVDQPQLWFPEPRLPFHLATDASTYGIGAALFQVVNGNNRYIAFHSRALNESERNYSIPKKELLSAIVHVAHWRYYLYGSKFTLYMDNQGITFAFNSTNGHSNNNMIRSWISMLAEYTFDVVHLPGIDNKLPDLCSRVQEVNAGNTIDVQVNTVVVGSDLTADQVTKILEASHAVGHFGADIMYKDIIITREIQGIKGLKKLCKDFYDRCEVCRQITDYFVGYSPLKEPTTLTPMEYVHVDILSKQRSNRGFTYCYVFVCSFTRFVWIKIAAEKTAEQTALFFLEIFSSFGFPSRIKTDEGGEFDNEVIRLLNDNTGVLHHTTLPYNHHSNGLVERTIRTVRQVLDKNTMELTNDPCDWDLVIFPTQLQMNARVHPQTAATPFALMFGRQPFRSGTEPLDNNDVQKAINEFKLFWITYHRFVVPKIMAMKYAAFERNKYHRKVVEFDVGDLVMYKFPQRKSKNETPFVGPFRVTKRLKHSIYEVVGNNAPFRAPANFLKKVRERAEGETLYDGDISELDDPNFYSEEYVEDFRDGNYEPPALLDRSSSSDQIGGPDIFDEYPSMSSDHEDGNENVSNNGRVIMPTYRDVPRLANSQSQHRRGYVLKRNVFRKDRQVSQDTDSQTGPTFEEIDVTDSQISVPSDQSPTDVVESDTVTLIISRKNRKNKGRFARATSDRGGSVSYPTASSTATTVAVEALSHLQKGVQEEVTRQMEPSLQARAADEGAQPMVTKQDEMSKSGVSSDKL